jgi:hypothetical protein
VELIGQVWTFWLYGLFAVAALVFCYYLVPETNATISFLKPRNARWKKSKRPGVSAERESLAVLPYFLQMIATIRACLQPSIHSRV